MTTVTLSAKCLALNHTREPGRSSCNIDNQRKTVSSPGDGGRVGAWAAGGNNKKTTHALVQQE